MKWPRNFGNGVVLANGQVVAVGGLDNGKGFSDDGAIRPAELFNPATQTWTELSAMDKPRPYHSIALLLADGRVLVGGGGLCSSSDNCAVNHPDVEILSPPYLFSGTRPGQPTAPGTVTTGSSFSVTVSGTVSGFSLVRLAGVTHSTNTDQRFMRLSFSGSGGSYSVQAPANKNIAPPGYYMLFALNGQAPSTQAAMVRVPTLTLSPRPGRGQHAWGTRDAIRLSGGRVSDCPRSISQRRPGSSPSVCPLPGRRERARVREVPGLAQLRNCDRVALQLRRYAAPSPPAVVAAWQRPARARAGAATRTAVSGN